MEGTCTLLSLSAEIRDHIECYLSIMERLRLASCNKELAKERDKLISVRKCGLCMEMVADALTQVVNRNTLKVDMRNNGGRQETVRWQYTVISMEEKLLAFGNFADAEGRAVFLDLIPHFRGEGGWYMVLDKQSGRLLKVDTYTNTVQELLMNFRAHVDPVQDEVEAEKENAQFEKMQAESAEKQRVGFLDFVFAAQQAGIALEHNGARVIVYHEMEAPRIPFFMTRVC